MENKWAIFSKDRRKHSSTKPDCSCDARSGRLAILEVTADSKNKLDTGVTLFTWGQLNFHMTRDLP
jgi:hypothetical protein